MTPFYWTGRAWRGSNSTQSWLSRGCVRKTEPCDLLRLAEVPHATVADIVRFEQDELGNNINVTKATLKKLENIPANRAIWVTKMKRDAQRYGKAFEVYLGDNCVAVGHDGGDGGFLVVCSRARS